MGGKWRDREVGRLGGGGEDRRIKRERQRKLKILRNDPIHDLEKA